MKKLTILLLAAVCCMQLKAQKIQATIKPNPTDPYSVDVYFKPDYTYALNYFDNLTISVAIPSTVSPVPTAVITTGDINAMTWSSVIADGHTDVGLYAGYLYYTFITQLVTSIAPVPLTAGVEFRAATIKFNSPSINKSQVYLVSLDQGSGGSNNNTYTYIQMSGTGTNNGQVSPDPTAGGVLFYSNSGESTIGQYEAGSPWVRTNALINLPLKLSSFSGVAKNCSAALTWLTNDEVNFKQFEVEQSFDGHTYNKVATIPSAGKLTGNNYNYTVAQNDATAYYRLKLVDNDSRFEYGDAVVIKTNCGTNAYSSIYPNPADAANALVTLNFSAAYNGKAQIVFFNQLGQPVLNNTTTVNKGANIVKVNTAALPAGAYSVKMTAADGSNVTPVQKFIKQ